MRHNLQTMSLNNMKSYIFNKYYVVNLFRHPHTKYHHSESLQIFDQTWFEPLSRQAMMMSRLAVKAICARQTVARSMGTFKYSQSHEYIEVIMTMRQWWFLTFINALCLLNIVIAVCYHNCHRIQYWYWWHSDEIYEH